MNCQMTALYFLKLLTGLDPLVQLKYPRHKVWTMIYGN